jgi:ABC-type transporter lipoprotein component MlaA
MKYRELVKVLYGGGWSVPCPSCFTPGKQTMNTLHKKIDRLQGWYRQVWKTSPKPGFERQTIQPVPNHYTDYTNPAH